jgi:hypothetical protein
MLIQQKMTRKNYFDAEYCADEQLPCVFDMTFKEYMIEGKAFVRVIHDNDGKQIGDVINDNSYIDDFYRYHDVFHYSFASLLGWSPCTRSMFKCKRKSNSFIDEHEDGARATITEEAISLLIFNEAKRNGYFEKQSKVSQTLLKIIKEMTENFEVRSKSKKEWANAILQGYSMFRLLIEHRGGRVKFDGLNKRLEYIQLN